MTDTRIIEHVELRDDTTQMTHTVDVVAHFADGDPMLLFAYFPDEIRFSEGELDGLTVEEAHALLVRRDREYRVYLPQLLPWRLWRSWRCSRGRHRWADWGPYWGLHCRDCGRSRL